MPRYAAFLRAVNLGRTRKTPSAALCAAFEELGFADVASFRTSGNVVFSSTGRAGEKALTKRVEAGLEDAFGFEVPVFLRSAGEVRAIAAQEPFDPKLVARSAGKLQIDLLLRAPSAAARKSVLDLATSQDRLAIQGRELYWLPSGGMMDSELDLKAIDRLVGPLTKRTMGTVQTIATKFFAD
jgi:uncharacterized protein (DUF1697 family)